MPSSFSPVLNGENFDDFKSFIVIFATRAYKRRNLLSYTAEEGDVVERRVTVYELKRKQLNDEHVVVLRLSSMILCSHTDTHRQTDNSHSRSTIYL